MTPQLRQAIKILQVSRAELETLIDQELTRIRSWRSRPRRPRRPAGARPRCRPSTAPRDAPTNGSRPPTTSRKWRPRARSARSTGKSSPTTTRTTCTARRAAARRTTTTTITARPSRTSWSSGRCCRTISCGSSGSPICASGEGDRRRPHRQPRPGRLPPLTSTRSRFWRSPTRDRREGARALQHSIRRASRRATCPSAC